MRLTNVTLAACVCSLFAAAATAQQTPPAKQTDPPPPVVLTGCVAAGTEGKEPRLMLINASAAPSGIGKPARPPEAGSTGVGTTGTGTSGTGATPSPTTAQDSAQVNVLLTSDRSVSLQRHVNRRVEVEGRMTDGPEPAAADTPRQLHVTKVRRLPGDCSRPKK